MNLMKQRFAPCFLCLLAACSSSGVPLAPQKSPHFDAVSARLQLGGTVYAYADIAGDAERAADFLLALLRDLPGLAPQQGANRLNATTLVRILGLHNVQAIGLSSYEKESLYHNRSFIHHAGGREGLLKLFGTKPADFDLMSIAPEDADLVWEQQLDVRVLVDIVRALGELGVGMTPEELDKALGEPVLGLDITLGAIIERLNTTAGLILAVDESRPLRIPGEPFWFPYTDFLGGDRRKSRPRSIDCIGADRRMGDHPAGDQTSTTVERVRAFRDQGDRDRAHVHRQLSCVSETVSFDDGRRGAERRLHPRVRTASDVRQRADLFFASDDAANARGTRSRDRNQRLVAHHEPCPILPAGCRLSGRVGRGEHRRRPSHHVKLAFVSQVDTAHAGIRGTSACGGRDWGFIPQALIGPKVASHVTRANVVSRLEVKP
jgi:hypothetical protein